MHPIPKLIDDLNLNGLYSVPGFSSIKFSLYIGKDQAHDGTAKIKKLCIMNKKRIASLKAILKKLITKGR